MTKDAARKERINLIQISYHEIIIQNPPYTVCLRVYIGPLRGSESGAVGRAKGSVGTGNR